MKYDTLETWGGLLLLVALFILVPFALSRCSEDRSCVDHCQSGRQTICNDAYPDEQTRWGY